MALLARTSATLHALLSDLPAGWTDTSEGPGTWTPHQVVAHLLHAECTNWMPRVISIVHADAPRPFPPFDRDGHLQAYADTPLAALLERFAETRRDSLASLAALPLDDAQLARTGLHPAFGAVTLRELLATWVAHDLSHLTQITRVMARRYTAAVGPWRAYLSVLRA